MITTILIFVAVLGVLIFVHEFGHFLAAKRSGLTVHEFGFGFPPRIAGIRHHGTLYSINWIPIGGFVKIKGENGTEGDEPDSFSTLPAWRRSLVLLAGVGMNVLLAVVLLGFAFSYGAPTALDESIPAGATVRDPKIQVISVLVGSPAEHTGIQAGDSVLSIDGKAFGTVEEIQQYNNAQKGQEETVTLKRDSQQVTLVVTPSILAEGGDQAVWGVNLVPIGIVSFPWYEAIWLGVRQAASLFWAILVSFAELIKNIVVHQKLSADIAGPVGIAQLTGQVVHLGFLYLVQFTALLSLNLALVNALPFPALDGGRVLFIIIEKIRGKRIDAHTEAVIHNIGFALLLLLVLVVTFQDVNRITGGLLSFFGRLIGRTGG